MKTQTYICCDTCLHKAVCGMTDEIQVAVMNIKSVISSKYLTDIGLTITQLLAIECKHYYSVDADLSELEDIKEKVHRMALRATARKYEVGK